MMARLITMPLAPPSAWKNARRDQLRQGLGEYRADARDHHQAEAGEQYRAAAEACRTAAP